MKTFILLFYLTLTLTITSKPLRHIKNDVFGLGESFVYKIKYGFISGGFAKLEITDTTRVRGHLCLKIQSIAYSNKTVSAFYPVRDTNISYMDVNGLHSLKILKFIREGSYKRFRWTFFEPEKQLATTNDSTLKTSEFVQDILSAFYYFRLHNVKDSIDINTFDDYKNYPLRIYVKKRETVKTPAGKFKCIKLEPRLISSGIFMKKGKMWVWVTDDKRKMPVKLQFKLPLFGSIKCFLKEYKQGKIIEQEKFVD